MSEDGVFDERIARTYDTDGAEMFVPEVLGPTVDFLTELAGDRRAMEFAVGTGRVALALSARGVDVAGIEVSRAMVHQMMVKPGAERVQVTIGDMATTRVEGTFGLVYLVFNTITNLLTQDEQVACFCNAAAHLENGGHFVIEVFVPALRRLPIGENLVAFDVSDGHVGVDENDVVNQTLTSHHSGAPTVGPRSSTRHTDTRHRPSTTSWRASPASRCASDGAVGVAPPSQPRALRTCPCGRRPAPEPARPPRRHGATAGASRRRARNRSRNSSAV